MEFILNSRKLSPFVNRLRQKDPVLIVTIGDSNTGNFWFTKGTKQWPELLQTELRIKYNFQFIHLFNAGICGETAQDGLKRIERDVLRFNPDVTIIAFGSNDQDRRPPDAFTNDLSQLVERCMQNSSIAVLRSVPPVMEAKPDPPHIWKGCPELVRLVECTRKVAEQYEIPFIDIYGMWEKLEQEGRLSIKDLMHDEVHTNFEGHKLIASQLLPLFSAPPSFHFDR